MVPTFLPLSSHCHGATATRAPYGRHGLRSGLPPAEFCPHSVAGSIAVRVQPNGGVGGAIRGCRSGGRSGGGIVASRPTACRLRCVYPRLHSCTYYGDGAVLAGCRARGGQPARRSGGSVGVGGDGGDGGDVGRMGGGRTAAAAATAASAPHAAFLNAATALLASVQARLEAEPDSLHACALPVARVAVLEKLGGCKAGCGNATRRRRRQRQRQSRRSPQRPREQAAPQLRMPRPAPAPPPALVLVPPLLPATQGRSLLPFELELVTVLGMDKPVSGQRLSLAALLRFLSERVTAVVHSCWATAATLVIPPPTVVGPP